MVKKQLVTSADEWMFWYEAGHEKFKALLDEVERLTQQNKDLICQLREHGVMLSEDGIHDGG